MTDDDYDELADAIVEDTVHCDLCGSSWVLGGCEDGVVITPPRRSHDNECWPGGIAQLKLCGDCALFVKLTIEQWQREQDVCEHGILAGEWCEPCNREYKRAAAECESR